jgi:hypothetical protein
MWIPCKIGCSKALDLSSRIELGRLLGAKDAGEKWGGAP